MFQHRGDASNAWKGIVENVDILQKGLNMAVGNGQATLFWHHRWALKDPLLKVASPAPPREILDLTVKELWDPNRGWKFEVFADYLPAQVLKEIQSFEVMEEEDAVDEVYWNGSPSGGFTISSAIQIVRGIDNESVEDEKEWKAIWSMKVPQRVRFFVWLAVQDKLLHNANRFLRHMTQDPRCLMCGTVEENADHILRWCPAARIVWKKLRCQPGSDFFVSLFAEWVHSNIQQKGGDANHWPVVFAMTIWWLWMWRNERSFSRERSIPLDQVTFVLTKAGEVIKAFDQEEAKMGLGKRKREEQWIKWEYPRVGWVRLNTDGALKGNPGLAGAGGVIRGDRGEVLSLFAANCGVCTCTKAELLGVLRGLCVAWNKGFRKVQLTVDSENVVKLLVESTPANSPYIHIIQKCKALIIKGEWEVRIGHCYREANKVADWLANYGVSMDQRLMFFEAVPSALRAILLEDYLTGVAWTRRVPIP